MQHGSSYVWFHCQCHEKSLLGFLNLNHVRFWSTVHSLDSLIWIMSDPSCGFLDEVSDLSIWFGATEEEDDENNMLSITVIGGQESETNQTWPKAEALINSLIEVIFLSPYPADKSLSSKRLISSGDCSSEFSASDWFSLWLFYYPCLWGWDASKIQRSTSVCDHFQGAPPCLLSTSQYIGGSESE